MSASTITRPLIVEGVEVSACKNTARRVVVFAIPEGSFETMDDDAVVRLFNRLGELVNDLVSALPEGWTVEF